jgi:hypothetical protein
VNAKQLTLALVAAAALLLTGCGTMAYDIANSVRNHDAIEGDLPPEMQAHLKTHPGDIRFNRPKLVWKVVPDQDFGPEWHVLPDKVYLQIYKDKFNEVWDTMQLDQGAGKAYDVVVRIPILYQFPGHPMTYFAAGWSYEAEVIDPDTGKIIAKWDAGHDRGHSPFWGGMSDANPSCQEMGHQGVAPMVSLAVTVPLLGVKDGGFTNFEDVIDTYARWNNSQEMSRHVVYVRGDLGNFPLLHQDFPGRFKDMFWVFEKKGDLWAGMRTITMAETQRAAEKVGYHIDFPDYCYDAEVYRDYDGSDGPLELHLAPPGERKDGAWKVERP